MSCRACGHANPPDSNFCLQCGSALERSCARCHARLPTAARFCNQCGAPCAAADGTPAAPSDARPAARSGTAGRDPRAYTPRHLAERILGSKAALEGERKHVTVLFADLADSTSISEKIGPEAMHALMDRCFQRICEQVHRFEGTVNQFTGDGVMALFGAPVALEDAPRRAVCAALAIQAALAPLEREAQQQHAVAFRMRIGIHSGLVVVGRIGDDLRMDYTAVGDTTNLAARLEGIARPGSVLVSEAVQRLVADFFELNALGPTRLKGRRESVRAFEVVRERAVHGRIEARAEGGLTPLVGREHELDALRAAQASAQAGHGQMVFLVGEAGLGKSRLLYEFRLGLARDSHVWFEGRCASYASTTPFHPIVDGMRRRLGIDDRDDDASAEKKIAAVEAELGGELGWTLPFLRHLLALPAPEVAALDPVTRRSETFRALHARFLRVAAQKMLVFVIEDLHWIDPVSEELIGYLAESIPATRALLVLTHRPGYRHPFGDRSYHVRIALQALSHREMEAMARTLLESAALPAPLQALIASKAEGNPFFVEEVTRSLLEEGVLRRQDGGVVLARELSEVSVPDSIQDVLMARIDRLADEPKRAIQVASVIGREFALRLLERISEAGDRLRSTVDELRSLELIYEKAAHPELAFMFKHALTHDVAYDSVLVERRKALHRIVGLAIEELYRDRLGEHEEALAHHFERGEDWERAFLYHERASAKAAAAFANETAVEHCRQALALAPRLGAPVASTLRVLEERLGDACWSTNAFRASAEAYERAAELAGDADGRARNRARAASSWLWAHAYPESRREVERALALARADGCKAAEVMALCVRDHLQTVLDGFDSDEPLVDQVTPLAEKLEDPEARVQAAIRSGLSLEMRGQYALAIEFNRSALAICRRERLMHAATFPSWSLGLCLVALGRYGEALTILREALELCDRLGDRAFKARILNTLGWCHAEFGSHERAREFNQACKVLAGELVRLGLVPGAPELYANGQLNLAGNRLAVGDVEGALEETEPVRAELGQPGDRWMRWRYGLHLEDMLARIDLARGEPDRALARAEAELAGARRHAAAKLVARALELRGRALVVMDRREEAAGVLVEALEAARQIGYPAVQWRAHALLAELARRAGRADEAARHVASVGALVDRLAPGLADPALVGAFRALGARLVEQPLVGAR